MNTLVTIECHEPMGRDRLVRQPWSDVSATFISEPGGTTYRFEPTLVSRARLEQDLIHQKHKLDKILKSLNEGAEFYVDARSPEDSIPDIYTRKDYIDQAEAERMLVYFLGTRGFTDLGFQWVWPEFIASVG